MQALSSTLVDCVTRHVSKALARNPGDAVRPILVGPPREALRAVFNALTSGGKSEWVLDVAGTKHEVVVLLVGENADLQGAGLSRACRWDYAVTIRNSRPLVLMLAERDYWDSRPESLANTTETIGAASSAVLSDDLHRMLYGVIGAKIELPPRQVRDLLRKVHAEAEAVGAAFEDLMSWRVVDRLLSLPDADPVAVCLAAGVPARGSKSLLDAYDVLVTLAELVAGAGLVEAFRLLKETQAGQDSAVSTALDDLQAHLAGGLLSPTEFENAPAAYYRVGGNVAPSWYAVLTASVLEEMLSELGKSKPQGRAKIECLNGVAGAAPLPGSNTFVVAGPPELRASTKETPSGDIVMQRKAPKQPAVELHRSPSSPFTFTDTNSPIHQKPLRYVAESTGYSPATVDVVALDAFACAGMVLVVGAQRNGVPVMAAKAKTWSQEIALARGGATELRVLVGASAASVVLSRDGETDKVATRVAGDAWVAFSESMENGEAVEITIRDTNGDQLGKWTVVFAVEEAVSYSGSVLEALVIRHRTRHVSVPQAPDVPIHRLEVDSYLAAEQSWLPVLACWSIPVPSKLVIDWTADPLLGDVRPAVDPRPTFTPPASLLAAREAVRQFLLAQQRCVAEIPLDGDAFASLVNDYVRAYAAWLAVDPASACWLDTICIYSADWNAQAGKHVTSDEPAVVLLSSLHPLRLGWHAVAQRQLVDSLGKECAVAGLVNPAQCPDATALYLQDGSGAKARAFFSLPCNNPHWTVLANAAQLDHDDAVVSVLMQLGLDVDGMGGGFTAEQTKDGLAEVSRLLPARSTLRISIVGEASSSTECARGVLEWSDDQSNGETSHAMQVDIYDAREAKDPSPEQLADLSERTDERVRWFRSTAPAPRLDLTIIDQLGARSPEATKGETRSVAGRGSLCRLRLREDFSNARLISESRVATVAPGGGELEAGVSALVGAFEGLAARDDDRTHYKFTPNQDAIASRLAGATFLSVTSSQIDPACMVRGAVVHGGYLWDYELPGLVGAADSGLGYYLIAHPTDAMEHSIETAATLIAGGSIDVKTLLGEVSRRGIPILKRLAAGGSQSRGEMGMLLATRWLQDCFRKGVAAPPRLPVWSGKCIHMILPVDPYEDIFERLGRDVLGPSASRQRPDLVVAAIMLDDAAISVRLTPVEVKFRAAGMSGTDMRAALGQAQALGQLMEELWEKEQPNALWRTCSSALLAHFLDFGFRIYAADYLHGRPHDDWTRAHQRTVQAVLQGNASVSINAKGRLVVFGGPDTVVGDIDGDGERDTIQFSIPDASAVFAGAQVSAVVADGVGALAFSLPGCSLETMPSSNGATPPSGPPSLTAPLPPQTPPDTLPPTQHPTPSDAPATPADADAAVEMNEHEAVREEVNQAAGLAEAASTSGSQHVSSSPRVPPEVRAQVRRAFEGFIGNEPAVARLSNDLLRALIEKPPHLAKNFLFTGLPSTGKTELARRMAAALKLPFVKLDGRGLTSRDKLFALVNGELATVGNEPVQRGERMGLPVFEYPPLIIFIDEVHLVSRALQESLLTMLEAADRTVVLEDQVAEVKHATFLFATTRASDVDAAFVSRCDEVALREYSEQEVAQIVRWKVPNASWGDEVYLSLARLGRCVPRVALQLGAALETAELVAEDAKSPIEHLDDVRRAREIDSIGVTVMDFEYLNIVERANGPIGEQNLLNLMRTVDKDRVVNEIEPFLVRLEYVKRGPRGRELTPKGRDYVLARRLRGAT